MGAHAEPKMQNLKKADRNLNQEILEHTAALYGFSSLDAL